MEIVGRGRMEGRKGGREGGRGRVVEKAKGEMRLNEEKERKRGRVKV